MKKSNILESLMPGSVFLLTFYLLTLDRISANAFFLGLNLGAVVPQIIGFLGLNYLIVGTYWIIFNYITKNYEHFAWYKESPDELIQNKWHIFHLNLNGVWGMFLGSLAALVYRLRVGITEPVGEAFIFWSVVCFLALAAIFTRKFRQYFFKEEQTLVLGKMVRTYYIFYCFFWIAMACHWDIFSYRNVYLKLMVILMMSFTFVSVNSALALLKRIQKLEIFFKE